MFWFRRYIVYVLCYQVENETETRNFVIADDSSGGSSSESEEEDPEEDDMEE